MDIKTSPLHLRPAVLPGRSAAGYLMRMFEINGEPWSRERFKKRTADARSQRVGVHARRTHRIRIPRRPGRRHLA